MAYIGIISDTHGFFDTQVMDFLRPVEQIWHAGDFGSMQCLDRVCVFKKDFVGVYGNCDDYHIRQRVPYMQEFVCEGKYVLMMHIGGYPGRYDLRAMRLIEAYRPDIFVCGHSHILRVMNDRHYGMLVINPGAAGISGFHKVRTAVRFHIDNGNIHDMEVGEWPKNTTSQFQITDTNE